MQQIHLAGHRNLGTPYHRHPRRADRGPGVGTLPRGGAPLRKRLDHDRARRQHPAARRSCWRNSDRRGTSPPRNWIIAWRRIYESAAPGPDRIPELPAAAGRPDRGRRRRRRARMCTGGWTSTPTPIACALSRRSKAISWRCRRTSARSVSTKSHVPISVVHPSVHFSLRYYGQRLARFLVDTAPYRNEPLLAGTAISDRALTDSFDAADSPVATVDNDGTDCADRLVAAGLVPSPPRLQRLNLRIERADPVEGRRQGRAIALARKDAPSRRLGHVAPGTVKSISVAVGGRGARARWVAARREFRGALRGSPSGSTAQNVAVHAAGLLKQWLTDGLIKEIKSG